MILYIRTELDYRVNPQETEKFMTLFCPPAWCFLQLLTARLTADLGGVQSRRLSHPSGAWPAEHSQPCFRGRLDRRHDGKGSVESYSNRERGGRTRGSWVPRMTGPRLAMPEVQQGGCGAQRVPRAAAASCLAFLSQIFLQRGDALLGPLSWPLRPILWVLLPRTTKSPLKTTSKAVSSPSYL